MGVTDLALTCGSEPVMGAGYNAVVGSDHTSRVLDAIAKTDLRRMLRCDTR